MAWKKKYNYINISSLRKKKEREKIIHLPLRTCNCCCAHCCPGLGVWIAVSRNALCGCKKWRETTSTAMLMDLFLLLSHFLRFIARAVSIRNLAWCAALLAMHVLTVAGNVPSLSSAPTHCASRTKTAPKKSFIFPPVHGHEGVFLLLRWWVDYDD